ncbi:MAG: P1 family peptidase [Chlorobi bacterium]|nr:P1 family peptidase [Chlorobiota bacterium]
MKFFGKYLISVMIILTCLPVFSQQQRLRDAGIIIGVLPPGKNNAITDVSGVKVGHVTLFTDSLVCTGVTAIIPHNGNIFQEKVPAAVYVGNGFGKMTGISQIRELGNIETPVILTNTLSVPVAANALIKYTLGLPGNENVRSVNPVVGETNDGYLNDIRGSHVTEADVLEAIRKAHEGPVKEGCVGAGRGTVCFGFKGGIGTASRVIPESLGGYTVGVLVQSNFGGNLMVDGIPVGEKLGNYYLHRQLSANPDGSCMMIVATDAPLDARNLYRLAKRAMLGLAKTGGISSNGSGDYVIAFSTSTQNRMAYHSGEITQDITVVRNDAMSPLFMAVIESTEEAILNSLFMATTTTGYKGHTVKALPVNEVLRMCINRKDHDGTK